MATITIATDTIDNYQGVETAPRLRYLLSRTIAASNGDILPKSIAEEGEFYLDIVCSASGTTVTYPEHTIDSTLDATPDRATYTLGLYTADGDLIQILFRRQRVPATPTSTTIAAIVAYNEADENQGLPADTYYDVNEINTLLNGKQATLVSGTNIKTINGNSLLGSGDLVINANSYFALLSDYASLAAAITAIGSTPTVLIIDENATVTTNVVVPTTCVFKFVKGYQITITNPGTIEFQGQGVMQEDLEGTSRLFNVPQPLAWYGNVTLVRNSTTITQNGNNYDAISARDAGRFVYLPDINLRTTVASVANANQMVLSQAVPTADFALAALSGSFTATANNDTFTLANHGFAHSLRVRLTGGSLPAGVVAGTTYYVIATGANTFKLATNWDNALALTAINLTTDGSGTVTATNADTFTAVGGTDVFTSTADHRFRTGQMIQLSGGSLPTGVVAATNYFVIVATVNTFKLAASYADAIGNTPIDITTDGSGSYSAAADIVIDEPNSNLGLARGYFTKRDHGLTTGYKVRLTTTGTLPNGYATGTDYWVIKHTDDTFKLASTERNAFAGNPIALTDSGIGTHTVDATLSGSNDYLGAHAFVYNLAWTGTVYPGTISTAIFDTSDMGSISYAGVAAAYLDMGLSGDINVAGLALANKSVQINAYPTDFGFGFYGSVFSNHVLEFQAGYFANNNVSQAAIAYFSDTTIRGKGMFSTVISESLAQGLWSVFRSANTNNASNLTRVENIEISDFQILAAPRAQVARNGAAQSDATITGGRVKNAYVHDIYLNGTASLGIFMGEGISSTSTELYTEDVRLVDNWFYNMSSQAIGVTAGGAVEVSRNKVRLSSAYDASAITMIDIEPIGSLTSVDALSAIRVNDNFLDGRNRRSSIVNGINFVAGEWRGFRGIEVVGNYIFGNTPEASDSATAASPNVANAIILNDVMSGTIANNHIVDSNGTRGIWAIQCGYLTIKDNVFYGHGYNDTIRLEVCSNNIVSGNISHEPPNNVLSNQIVEVTASITVDTNGTAVTFLGSGTVGYLSSSLVNSVLRISGVDYEVDEVTSNTTLTLKTSAGVQSSIVGTMRPVRNKYRDNTAATYTTVDTSASLNSVIYSRFDDFRLSGNVTIDPANVAANTVASQNFTLTGAKTGDSLILNPPTAGLTAGLLVLQTFVSATDQITVVFHNTTGAPIDEASATWRYTLLR